MLKIELTQDKEMIVDNDDYIWLKDISCQFHHQGYAVHTKRIKNKIKQYLVHRMILGLTDSKIKVDHINGNKLDNRKSNLRIATTQQNGMNRTKIKKFTSKYKGVGWNKRNKKWRAIIYLNNKCIYIGAYKTELEAAKAYNKKAKELYGEFAKLNEV